MPRILTVNIAQPMPNPYKRLQHISINKRPVDRRVHIAAPGPTKGMSGVAGDLIGDAKNHGGDDQAVYAFAREDLDRWESILDRPLPNGAFGENLTTAGIDVNEALVGERWRIGPELILEIPGPRIPCATFHGIMDRPTWLKDFTRDARPGPYFRVESPGSVGAGDAIEVIDRPPHDVSVAVVFQALTTKRSLVPRVLAAADHLPEELVEFVRTFEPTGDLA